MTGWKSITAGILELVAGALHLVMGVAFVLFGNLIALASNLAGVPDFGFAAPVPIVGGIGIPLLVLALFELLGGISALRGRHWGLSLFGAICAIVPLSTPLGITAVVFLALAREEFR